MYSIERAYYQLYIHIPLYPSTLLNNGDQAMHSSTVLALWSLHQKAFPLSEVSLASNLHLENVFHSRQMTFRKESTAGSGTNTTCCFDHSGTNKSLNMLILFALFAPASIYLNAPGLLKPLVLSLTYCNELCLNTKLLFGKQYDNLKLHKVF